MDWDYFLDEICVVISSSLNTTEGDTPHIVLFHFYRRDMLTRDTFVTDNVLYSYDDYYKTIEYKGYLICQYIKSHMDIQIDSLIENDS